MKKTLNRLTDVENNERAYVIFRVLVGILFSFHGMQKLFGWFTQNGAQELISLMGFVGTIELIGGIMIAVGFFARFAATASGVIVIAAFFKAHFTLANPVPIANRGELALVYLAAFILIASKGAGKHSIDDTMRIRRVSG